MIGTILKAWVSIHRKMTEKVLYFATVGWCVFGTGYIYINIYTFSFYKGVYHVGDYMTEMERTAFWGHTGYIKARFIPIYKCARCGFEFEVIAETVYGMNEVDPNEISFHHCDLSDLNTIGLAKKIGYRKEPFNEDSPTD